MRKQSGLQTGLRIVLWMLILGMLTGCGEKKPQASENPETSEPTASAEPEKEPFDLLHETWKDPGELTAASDWWSVCDYAEVWFDSAEQDAILGYTAVDGLHFYYLHTAYTKEPEAEYGTDHYILYHFNGEEMTFTRQELLAGDLFEERGVVGGLSAVNGQLTLYIADQEWSTQSYRGKNLHAYAVCLNEDGSFGEAVDFLPALENCGLLKEMDGSIPNGTTDGQGLYYFSNKMSTKVYVLNRDGECLEILDGFDDDRYRMNQRFHTDDGQIVWEAKNKKTEECTYFTYSPEGIRKLYQGKISSYGEWAVTSYGEILYQDDQSDMVRWNARTGTVEKLFAGEGNITQYYPDILVNQEGNIILVQREDRRLTASVFSPIGAAQQVELTLLSYNQVHAISWSYLNDFMRRHPNVKITVKEPADLGLDAWEDDWNRFLAEISSGGEMPDLLLLPQDKLRMLQEKGLLADLSDVLPKHMKEQIFPGVLEFGSIDGKLYGMVIEAQIHTKMVFKELWPGDTWTSEDLLQLIEAQEKKGIAVQAITANAYYGGPQRGSMFFEDLIGDLAHSSLLDLEKGTCSFDSDLFLRMLETAKRLGLPETASPSPVSEEELLDFCHEGKALTYRPDGDLVFPTFSTAMAAFGNSWHDIGSATNGDSGSYWDSYVVMAVSETTKNREIVDEFLRSLYEQNPYIAPNNMIIREDVLRNNIVYIDHLVGMRIDGNGSWTEVRLKPDGSSYLEEYIDLLKHATAKDKEAEKIHDMVMEEVAAFFNGDKDAKTVAGIIQSRVQLYLDERK